MKLVLGVPDGTTGAAINSSLAPAIVQGVDQIRTEMLSPKQSSLGLVRQPWVIQSENKRPGGTGAPRGGPIVEPGCVMDPATAETAEQSDNAPAAANFVRAVFIFSLQFRGDMIVNNHLFQVIAAAPTVRRTTSDQRRGRRAGNGLKHDQYAPLGCDAV